MIGPKTITGIGFTWLSIYWHWFRLWIRLEWMNEWMNEPFIEFSNTGSHPVGTRKKIILREQTFLIGLLLRWLSVFRSSPLPTPCGKDMSRIRYSSVPYPGFYHAPVQPLRLENPNMEQSIIRSEKIINGHWPLIILWHAWPLANYCKME